MANPQVEKGHIRIANELYDEILRRNFSKRQQNLVLFIWRLSYGTGQKDCEVNQFNLFELAGIYRSDIRKELNYLRECAVLNWTEKDMVFSINKNYKLWQITPNKNWDSEKFNSLIHLNINRKKVSKTLTNNGEKVSKLPTDEKPKVSELPTNESKPVSKLLTMKLVKHQLPKPLNLRRTRLGWVPIDIIRDIKDKNIKDNNNNPFTFFEKNIAPLSPHIIDSITDWTEMFPDEVVLFSMELAVNQNKRSMNYCNAVLANWKNEGVKNLADAKRSHQEFIHRQQSRFGRQPEQPEIIPEWFNNRKQQNKQQQQQEIDPATAEKERQELADMIRQYS